MQPNYESIWWGYIYDQMMAEDPELVDTTLRFYQTQLQGVSGPVLECACGTGIIMLPLLAQGHDIYGFDISHSMLNSLHQKASKQGINDIERRLSVQNLESFEYDQRFAAIQIPTNTFLMLVTQDAQIRALRQIYTHLAPDGRFLFDIWLTGMGGVNRDHIAIEGNWYTWVHPETGLPIRQRRNGIIDLDKQLVIDQCYIEYEAQKVDFPMIGRFIFKDELQLLLRLAGFSRWEAYGTPEGTQLQVGLEEVHSYWVVYKN